MNGSLELHKGWTVMRVLDLHGVRHAEARNQTIRFVEDGLNRWDMAQVVTGHSQAMRDVVIGVLDEYKLEYNVGGYLGTDPAMIIVKLEGEEV